MILKINKFLFSFIISGLIFILIPSTTYAKDVSNINRFVGVTQQKTIINYEKSQPSSIDKKLTIWKIKSIVPINIKDLPLNPICKIF